MQNQRNRNSFLNPTANAFTSRTRQPLSTSAPGGGLPREEARQHEDAWTPYDGLGPVPSRNPRLEGNWRGGGQPSNGNGGRGGSSNGRGNHRGGSPVNQPANKRAKQTPAHQQGRGGANARGQSARGDRASRATGRQLGELIDEAYLDSHYPKLKKEDFPNAPQALFNNPKAFLWDNKGTMPKSSFASTRGNGVITCTVFLKAPDGSRIEAVGESTTKVCFALNLAINITKNSSLIPTSAPIRKSPRELLANMLCLSFTSLVS
jgi:ATP-dependent RNA helicase DHX36